MGRIWPPLVLGHIRMYPGEANKIAMVLDVHANKIHGHVERF
jgi:hypothetical protein